MMSYVNRCAWRGLEGVALVFVLVLGGCGARRATNPTSIDVPHAQPTSQGTTARASAASIERCVVRETGAHDLTTAYEFHIDADGRLAEILWGPSGARSRHQVRRQYDGRGRVVAEQRRDEEDGAIESTQSTWTWDRTGSVSRYETTRESVGAVDHGKRVTMGVTVEARDTSGRPLRYDAVTRDRPDDELAARGYEETASNRPVFLELEYDAEGRVAIERRGDASDPLRAVTTRRYAAGGVIVDTERALADARRRARERTELDDHDRPTVVTETELENDREQRSTRTELGYDDGGRLAWISRDGKRASFRYEGTCRSANAAIVLASLERRPDAPWWLVPSPLAGRRTW